MRILIFLTLLAIGTASADIIPSICWKAELTGLVGATPSYDNGSIYVANWYGWGQWNPGLYRLNASTGQIEWRNENISGAGRALVIEDTVIIGNLSGHLFFVNATTGIIEKSLLLETQPSWYGIASSPVFYNGTIYVHTFSNSTIWALKPDGSIKWKFSANVEGSPYASPFAHDGKILFSAENKIFCLNENGEQLWNFTAESKITNSPVATDENIFFATQNYLYALDLGGNLLWKTNWNGSLSNAMLLDSKVCIGGKNGFACFNSTNGEKLWFFETDKVDSTPVAQNGRIYFATNVQQGTLYALNASDGKLLWFYRLIPPEGNYYNIMSSPIIAEGKLFIGSDSGFVYCFNSSGIIELNVTLYPGNYTEKIGEKIYEVSKTSGLGALHFASLGSKSNDAYIGFSYELDDSWYQSSGSFFVSSIMGLSELWWTYYLNDESLWAGLNQIELSNGDRLYLLYGTGFETPENATTMIKINVAVKSAGIKDISASNGARGGNITAFVNVSTEEGWFVLVLSGLGNGDSIAGVSTFYAKGDLRVPVLVAIPQQVKTGIYRLYAGIYKLEDYPEKLITWFGPVEVEVR
ncbi:MAG: PQQ-binding-like beta-propeller repeat protein [Archaeoglobaceae archaeon]